MGRTSKFVSLKIGDGAYYDPKVSAASIKHNYRYLFLKAIESRTPEVLIALRSEVWPKYEPIYWRTPYEPEDYWKYTLHPALAYGWLYARKDVNSAPGDFNPAGSSPETLRAVAALKTAMLSWLSKFHIQSKWMMMAALDTLLIWTIYESTPGRIETEAKIRRVICKALGTADFGPSGGTQRAHPWGASRRWYFPKDPGQQFSYAGWAGEDPDEYVERLVEEFRAHIAPYLRNVKERARSLPPVPELKRPERFEMLALYLCREMSGTQISEAGFFADPSTIYRGIRQAADLVGLPLRKPGK